MRLPLRSLSLLAFAALAAGCEKSSLPYIPTPGIPFVHKIDVQQGNVVTQEMVGQLRLGMDQKKVRFVMGTPIIQDTFHSSRWDYIYTFHEGGGGTERRLITVVFNEDGRLIDVEGDVKPALGRLEVDRHQDTSVEVPERDKSRLLSVLKSAIPFADDDLKDPDDEIAEKVNETEEQTPENADASGGDESETIAATSTSAGAESVTVPDTAPPQKKKGFFQRVVDSLGLGADDEGGDKADDAPAEDDIKYRDPTDPDNQ